MMTKEQKKERTKGEKMITWKGILTSLVKEFKEIPLEANLGMSLLFMVMFVVPLIGVWVGPTKEEIKESKIKECRQLLKIESNINRSKLKGKL